MLIKHGADPCGVTPLMIAIMRGDVKFAEAEIKRGADVNAVNEFDRTAVNYAAPIAECLQLLLQHGAKHSFSTTEIATMLGDEVVLRRELENQDAPRNWQSEVRWAIFYDRPAILDLIIAKAPSAASEEFEFRTPVALAAEKGRLECLRVLIRRHADIHRLSEGGLSPMDLARRRENTPCLRFLKAVQGN